MRTDLADIIADLFHRIADVERRMQSNRRTGTIAEVDPDKGIARVKLGEDPKTGKPYLSPWVPWKMAAMGATKVNMPPSVGQQVEIVSESGDLTDAIIDGSLRSNDNPLPGAKPGEGHITTGSTAIFFSGETVRITTPHYRVEAGKVEFVQGGGGGGGGQKPGATVA